MTHVHAGEMHLGIIHDRPATQFQSAASVADSRFRQLRTCSSTLDQHTALVNIDSTQLRQLDCRQRLMLETNELTCSCLPKLESLAPWNQFTRDLETTTTDNFRA